MNSPFINYTWYVDSVSIKKLNMKSRETRIFNIHKTDHFSRTTPWNRPTCLISFQRLLKLRKEMVKTRSACASCAATYLWLKYSLKTYKVNVDTWWLYWAPDSELECLPASDSHLNSSIKLDESIWRENNFEFCLASYGYYTLYRGYH